MDVLHLKCLLYLLIAASYWRLCLAHDGALPYAIVCHAYIMLAIIEAGGNEG